MDVKIYSKEALANYVISLDKFYKYFQVKSYDYNFYINKNMSNCLYAAGYGNKEGFLFKKCIVDGYNGQVYVDKEKVKVDMKKLVNFVTRYKKIKYPIFIEITRTNEKFNNY